MGRMKNVFDTMMSKNEKILVSYFPSGDTIVEDTVLWAGKFYENGTTVLEMGFPYENPYLDGQVVVDSMARSMSRKDLKEILEDVKKIREAYPNAIIQGMTYVEVVLKYGYETFAKMMADADIDALLVANANFEQRAELDKALSVYDIDNLRFVPYHINEKIVEDLKKNASGYIYLQAVDGQTGSRAEITDQIEQNIKALRAAGITVPLIPGFGISTVEHIKKYLSMGSDGVIVGSAIIKNIIAGTGERYIKSLSDALK